MTLNYITSVCKRVKKQSQDKKCSQNEIRRELQSIPKTIHIPSGQWLSDSPQSQDGEGPYPLTPHLTILHIPLITVSFSIQPHFFFLFNKYIKLIFSSGSLHFLCFCLNCSAMFTCYQFFLIIQI